MLPGETIAREALAAWEQAASKLSEAAVRDPRTLDLGAVFLRASLTWQRAADQCAAHWVAQTTEAFRVLSGAAR